MQLLATGTPRLAPVVTTLVAVACILGCETRPKTPVPPQPEMEAPSPDKGLTPQKKADVAPNKRSIVCLAPNLTEIVFALGAGDRVIGVSDYATHPPEVTKLPRVGGLLNPNMERILELGPDVVLLHAGNKELSLRLQKLGLRTQTFSADKIDEIYRVILRVGQVVGSDLDAGALVTGMKRELRDITAPNDVPRVKVLVVVGRTEGTLQGLRSAGPGSYIHEIIALAGGDNIAAKTGKAWPEMSKETILAAQPDVIIELAPGSKEDETKALTPWQALGSVPAVKNGRIHRLTDDHLLIPGPRLVSTARDIRGVLDLARPEPPPEKEPGEKAPGEKAP